MKKKIKLIILAIFLIGVLWWTFSNDYDSSKPTEFYEINDGTYVVRNAPYDTAEIRKVIEKFNLETLLVDSIKKYGRYGRLFYRETKYMTRNFKEEEEYDPVYQTWNNIQDFRNHFDDVLMQMSYSIDPIDDGDSYYSYWLNWNYGKNYDVMYDNRVRICFRDLDSLYSAKKKEYGIE